MSNILTGLALGLFFIAIILFIVYISNVKEIVKDTTVFIICGILVICAIVSAFAIDKAEKIEKAYNKDFVLIEADGTSAYYDKNDFINIISEGVTSWKRY